MANNISKALVDKDLRNRIFAMILNGETDNFERINDRQYGILVIDLNGEQRYVRVGAIVAEIRDDMTAQELMESEISAYQAKQDEKEIKRLKREKKAAADKAKREKAKEDAEQE